MKPNLILLPQLLPVIRNIRPVYNICVSQGSVATRLRRGGNLDNSITNCLRSVTVKELLKLTNIWQRYGQSWVARFYYGPKRHHSFNICYNKKLCYDAKNQAQSLRRIL